MFILMKQMHIYVCTLLVTTLIWVSNKLLGWAHKVSFPWWKEDGWFQVDSWVEQEIETQSEFASKCKHTPMGHMIWKYVGIKNRHSHDSQVQLPLPGTLGELTITWYVLNHWTKFKLSHIQIGLFLDHLKGLDK
jgi:hypothetical protein